MEEVLKDVQVPKPLMFLVDGYAQYAKEVVVDRAIVNIDGLKPSQRRILYTMKSIAKVKDFTKCSTISGQVLSIHPHGDASVYDTMTRMIDLSEHTNIPLIEGKGFFGKVYSDEPPAAPRYTNARLSPLADELFKDMDGIRMLPSYDGGTHEPELLPVTFPLVLCNPNSGIGVGISSNIPSFNFNEVNNAVIEFIETGDIKKPLAPDYPNGGYYVYNEKELKKIMETGKGRVKLRGNWYIDGKTIIIDNIPYYTKAKTIVTAAEKIKGVSNADDITGRENGFTVIVECSRKKDVDEVLTELLRTTDLQLTFTTNIVVIVDNKPRVIGVKELISEWVKFRKGVLGKQLQTELDNLIRLIAQYTVFADLINDEAKRLKFTETLAKDGAVNARKLLVEWYPDAEKFVYDWILDMRLRQFSRTSDVMGRLVNYKERKKQVESDLNDLDSAIVRQLKELNSKYKFPRKTEITDKDYVFEERKDVVVKADPVPVVVEIDGKFIKKMHDNRLTQDIQGIRCLSDGVISFIDTKGRLLRVDLENIEFMSPSDRGIYLPVYLEEEDDFDIVAYELIRDTKIGYIYSDGFASVVDYSEWVDGKRVTRITQNGVSPYSSLIIDDFDFSKAFLFVITNEGRIGIVSTDFKQKHRTARTRVVNLKKDEYIIQATPISYPEALQVVTNTEDYVGKVRFLGSGDTFNADFLQSLV